MANAKIIEKKKERVENIKEKIASAKTLIISDYRGVTVKQITELRKKLRSEDSEYKIIKNTLVCRALAETGFEPLVEHMQGPSALLLGYGDPVGPLKALVDFFDEVEKGQIKGGFVEKKIVKSEEIAGIAKLPSREELLAKMVGGFQSPIYGLVNVLQGNIRKLVWALNAVKEKKEKG